MQFEEYNNGILDVGRNMRGKQRNRHYISYYTCPWSVYNTCKFYDIKNPCYRIPARLCNRDEKKFLVLNGITLEKAKERTSSYDGKVYRTGLDAVNNS